MRTSIGLILAACGFTPNAIAQDDPLAGCTAVIYFIHDTNYIDVKGVTPLDRNRFRRDTFIYDFDSLTVLRSFEIENDKIYNELEYSYYERRSFRRYNKQRALLNRGLPTESAELSKCLKESVILETYTNSYTLYGYTYNYTVKKALVRISSPGHIAEPSE